MTDRIRALYHRMIDFDAGDPDLIQHFSKVHAYAKLIAESEHMDPHMSEVLEAGALVHDIAIPLCNQKYGAHPGNLQEQEGPPLVREMLAEMPFAGDEVDRIAQLVGEHHTCVPVDGMDHQILLEADFIVNSFENEYSREQLHRIYRNVFATFTGKHIYYGMFALGQDEDQYA